MTARFIIESFRQTKFNCAIVTLIKAAIFQYGLNRIMRKERRRGYWIITFKSGNTIALSLADLKRINKKNRIIFQKANQPNTKDKLNRIRQTVELCFAAMVRNIQVNGYLGKEYTESKAIKLLTREGMQVPKLNVLLGLPLKTRHPQNLSRRCLKSFLRKKAVLLYSATHVVVVSKGYYEDYGKAVRLGNVAPLLKKARAKAWLELK